MAERAKYLVTQPPGAYVEGVGFLKDGTIFEAPDPAKFPRFEPSRTFKPCNKAAVVELEKLKVRIKQIRDDNIAAQKMQAKLPEDQVDLEIYVPPVEEAKIQPDAVDPRSLRGDQDAKDFARLDADSGTAKGKRAADR